MESKLITVPFNVEKAKRITNGEIEGRIITRDGRDARIICWDRNNETYPIVVLVPDEEDRIEDSLFFTENGTYYEEGETNDDLFIQLPEYLTFKDGDVLSSGDDVFILKKIVWNNRIEFYACNYMPYMLFDADIEGLDIVNNLRLATESEKQKLIKALKESTDPLAVDCLKKLGVEVNPKFEFTTGQPVVGMKQHMIAKVESVKEYTAVIVEKSKERHKEDIDAVMKLFREGYVTLAFEAGWDAAVNYLAKLPFDKMLKYFNEVLNDVSMEEVIEENKDVLERLKDR